MDIYKVSRILAADCPGFVDSVELFMAEIGLDLNLNPDKFKELTYFGSARCDSIKFLLKEWISSNPSEANISNLIRILIKIKFCSEQCPTVNDIVEGVEHLELKLVPGQCVICGKATDLKCVRCSKGGKEPTQIPFYCGKEHQTEHWKGGHKKSCGSGSSLKQSKIPDVVGQLRELEKTYKKLGPTDILGEEDLQVVADIISDNYAIMDSWRLTMSDLGVSPDKYDEWEAASCPTLYLIALKTLMEWGESEKTLEKLTKLLNSDEDLENLIEYGFSHRRPVDPNTKKNKFQKGSIITGMKRNLSQEELQRVISINFEVPYADLDIMDEILDCGKLVEKSVKDIFLQVQDWDEEEFEQCQNIYKMLINPENKVLPYRFCGEGDDQLERIIVTVELSADDRLQGFGSDLMQRKYRNVYVN